MQSDTGKVFVGGISWDTKEERLRDYFSSYGEVVEVVILKDRNTGRARGFGFVVFANPYVAERVIMDRHIIDGRMVEAKKAVPRDDQIFPIRSGGSIHSSFSHGRTRKIFVGGLASTVTESIFKNYFGQFGTITDIVVMHDRNTQRPRGFGFITYDTEEAVDKVLLKTFHELNGKMVEVKQAVPKESSSSPSRSALGGYNYGPNRVNNFLNSYAQGYCPSGVRMDGRFSQIAGTQSGLPSSGSGYGMGLNFKPGPSHSYGMSASFGNSMNYMRGLNPYRFGNSSRFGGSIGGGSSSLFGTATQNLWGVGGLSYGTNSASANVSLGSGRSIGGNTNFSRTSWDASAISASGHGMDVGRGRGENAYALELHGHGRIGDSSVAQAAPPYVNGGCDRAFEEFAGGVSNYVDDAWRSVNASRDGPDVFGLGLGNAASDISAPNSLSFVGSYGATMPQSARENSSFR